jgi:hypothetical protein
MKAKSYMTQYNLLEGDIAQTQQNHAPKARTRNSLKSINKVTESDKQKIFNILITINIHNLFLYNHSHS